MKILVLRMASNLRKLFPLTQREVRYTVAVWKIQSPPPHCLFRLEITTAYISGR